jgi:hypothetical protein
VGGRAVLLLVALGLAHDPGCGTDTPAGGPNTPCTRSSDCKAGLTCTAEGTCAGLDSKVPDGGANDSGGGDAAGAD